jgi:hypothetical protein
MPDTTNLTTSQAFLAFLVSLLVWGSVTGVLNALLARKSQIETWAESHPRAAAVQKFMRAIGFDPWNAISAALLWAKGRLPMAQKAGTTVEDGKIKAPRIPGLPVLCLALMLPLALLGCSPRDGVPPASAADVGQVVRQDVAIAYAALCVVLELADSLETAYLDSLANPTAAQLDQAQAVVDRLKAARAILVELRQGFLDGHGKLRAALAELRKAVTLAQLAGVNVPDKVWSAMNGADAVLGGVQS